MYLCVHACTVYRYRCVSCVSDARAARGAGDKNRIAFLFLGTLRLTPGFFESSFGCTVSHLPLPLSSLRPRARGRWGPACARLPGSMSSSRKPARRANPSQPQEKPYKFKARPAPKNNIKSSFALLKEIVDTPVIANLAQVESGFRVSCTAPRVSP